MKTAILGAGNVGRRLHQLLGAAGQDVCLCVRESTPKQPGYVEGVAQTDIAVLAVPYLALAEAVPALAEDLRCKVVVDCTNPPESGLLAPAAGTRELGWRSGRQPVALFARGEGVQHALRQRDDDRPAEPRWLI